MTTDSLSYSTPEEEYKKLIKVNEDIQPLGDTPFGERIGLHDGSLSFEQVDVSVSGRGPLTVGRELFMHGAEDRPDLQNRAFADWDMSFPQIATVTTNQTNVRGWQVAADNQNAICTNFRQPPVVSSTKGATIVHEVEHVVDAMDGHWQGRGFRNALLRSRAHSRLRPSSVKNFA